MRCMSCGQELTTGGCVNYACPSRAIATSRGNPANDIHNNKTGIPQLERECRDLRISRDAWKALAEDMYSRRAMYDARTDRVLCAFCHGILFENKHSPDCPITLHQLLIEEEKE